MSHINVTINGRQYRMACEEGQEVRLLKLAENLETRIQSLRGKFGEIGDARLTVMAALTVCDELVDTSQRIRSLVLQHPDAVRRVGPRIGSEVDVPLAAQKMQFRRPHVFRIRTVRRGPPHNLLLRPGQVRDLSRLPDRQPVTGRVHEVIEAIPVNHPRVGARCQQGIDDGRRRLRAQYAAQRQGGGRCGGTVKHAETIA